MTREETHERHDLPDAAIEAAIAACPHAAAALKARPAAATHDLLTASQVERLMDPSSPLARTLKWVRTFLARPHKEVGRPGPVCPFVPSALIQDTIWLTQSPYGRNDKTAIVESVAQWRDRFLALDPREGDAAMSKALLIVFPNLTTEDAGLIDEIQYELKSTFVDNGIMLGEFHERNESPGLRNPEFRPLRSPIPMLAIRHMVETDLPFLQRTLYPPTLRAEFIRSYLRRLGANIARNSFDAALAALVTAEIEQLGAVKIVEMILTR